MIAKHLQRFIRRPILAISAFARDPLEAWTAFQDRSAARAEEDTPTGLYRAQANWESELHRLLGLSFPCKMTSEFRSLWPNVMAELVAKGIRPGPESFKGWNDGDAALVRAIWCLVRHLGAQRVVETGVAHGVTSRFILEALEENGSGHLWSIDHPPLEREWHQQIGIAVDGRFPERWTYISGSSRRRLPRLISQIGEIDLFVHDSLHSEHNVRFEVDQAWRALRPGGAIVVDDIDANCGFHSFTKAFSGHRSIICEAEPVHSDKRRFNDKGLFGIILKLPAALPSPH
jgi:Methyltransferase domain